MIIRCINIKPHSLTPDHPIVRGSKWVKVIIILVSAGVFLGACSQNSEQAEVMQIVAVETPVVADDPTTVSSQTSASEIEVTQTVETVSDELAAVPMAESPSGSDMTVSPLPERAGPRIQTSGTVPMYKLVWNR